MANITTVRGLLERFKGSKKNILIRKIGYADKAFHPILVTETDGVALIQFRCNGRLENLHLSDMVEFVTVVRGRLLREVYSRHKALIESVRIRKPEWEEFCWVCDTVKKNGEVVALEVKRRGKTEQIKLDTRVEYVRLAV